MPILPSDDGLFLFVSFEDEDEGFETGANPLELGKYRVLAAEGGVEFLRLQVREGFDDAVKFKPGRRGALRMEEDEAVASYGKFVPDFEVAPDSAEDLDMRKNSGDFHRI